MKKVDKITLLYAFLFFVVYLCISVFLHNNIVSIISGIVAGFSATWFLGNVRSSMLIKQKEFIQEYQQCGWVHPLTCGENSKHKVLEPRISVNRFLVDNLVLVCPDCGYTQTHIPESIYKIDIENDPKYFW